MRLSMPEVGCVRNFGCDWRYACFGVYNEGGSRWFGKMTRNSHWSSGASGEDLKRRGEMIETGGGGEE